MALTPLYFRDSQVTEGSYSPPAEDQVSDTEKLITSRTTEHSPTLKTEPQLHVPTKPNINTQDARSEKRKQYSQCSSQTFKKRKIQNTAIGNSNMGSKELQSHKLGHNSKVKACKKVSTKNVVHCEGTDDSTNSDSLLLNREAKASLWPSQYGKKSDVVLPKHGRIYRMKTNNDCRHSQKGIVNKTDIVEDFIRSNHSLELQNDSLKDSVSLLADPKR